jgi:hypothetical protein
MALMQIFLSYAGSEKAYAKSLASQLEKRGFSVWSPRDEVLPGDNVWLQTGEALKKSRAMVALLSRIQCGQSTSAARLNSRWVIPTTKAGCFL